MANFGDINASISLAAGEAIRRNAGNNAFEAFTPSTVANNSFGMSNLGNTSGTSGIISGPSVGMYFAGGENVTLSQSINGSSATITISAGSGTGGGITNINLSAGSTSQNLSKVTFADSNGVSFGLNGSVVTATVKTDYQTSGEYLTSQSNQALSGSNGGFAFQTATFGNLNGMSFYTSNGSMVGSYTVPTVPAQMSVGNSNIGNTSGDTGAVTGRLVFAGGNNITLSGSTNAGSMTITISAPNLGAGAGYSAGMSNIGNTSGTSGTVASQLVLAGGNNITLSQSVNGNSATVTISAGAGGAAGTLTGWEVFPQGNNSTFSSMGQNSFYLQKMNPGVNYAFSSFELRMSGRFVSSSNSQVAVYSIKYGLYSLNASSWSSIATSQMVMTASYNSTSAYGLTVSQGAGSYTITSNNTNLASYISGFKHLYLPFASTLTAGGNYGFGMIISSATTVNTGPMRVAILNQTIINNITIGKIFASTILASNKSFVGDFAMGVGSVTTGAMPTSININAITNQVSQGRIYIQLD